VLKSKYLIWCAALVVILACVPTLPAPSVSVPTIDPNAIGTVIMQTAFAASTQTQAAIPTATATVETPTPRNTDTPEPTATNTVIFILFSPTSNPLSGIGVSGGSSSDAYACKLSGSSPANGTSFNARTGFDAKWTVVNIGQRDWDNKSTIYAFLSGDKIHKVESYNLKTTIKSGESTSIVVEMIAPKDPGTYTTAWALRVDKTIFCPLTLTISVK